MTGPSSRFMARFSSGAHCVPALPKPWGYADVAHRLRRSSVKASSLRRKPSADPARAGSPRSAQRARRARRSLRASREGSLRAGAFYGRMKHRRKARACRAGWRSGSAGPLQGQGHRFKSCTGHQNQRRPSDASTRWPVSFQAPAIYLEFKRTRYGMGLQVAGRTARLLSAGNVNPSAVKPPSRWQKALEFGIPRHPSSAHRGKALAKRLVRENRAPTFRMVRPDRAGAPSESDTFQPFEATSAAPALPWGHILTDAPPGSS